MAIIGIYCHILDNGSILVSHIYNFQKQRNRRHEINTEQVHDKVNTATAPLRARTSYHFKPVTKTSQAKPEGDDKNNRIVCRSFSGTKSKSRRQNSFPS